MCQCPRCNFKGYDLFETHTYCPYCNYSNMVDAWHPPTEADKLAKLRSTYRIVSQEEMRKIKQRSEQAA